MAETTVTDEDGTEYRVDEADLREVKHFTEQLEEVSSAIVDVRHKPSHMGYDLVVDVNAIDKTMKAFGSGSGSEDILREAGYESEFAFFETLTDEYYDYDAQLYFKLHEL